MFPDRVGWRYLRPINRFEGKSDWTGKSICSARSRTKTLLAQLLLERPVNSFYCGIVLSTYVCGAIWQLGVVLTNTGKFDEWGKGRGSRGNERIFFLPNHTQFERLDLWIMTWLSIKCVKLIFRISFSIFSKFERRGFLTWMNRPII